MMRIERRRRTTDQHCVGDEFLESGCRAQHPPDSIARWLLWFHSHQIIISDKSLQDPDTAPDRHPLGFYAGARKGSEFAGLDSAGP